MVEGRISSGVVVGPDSDIGGGASIMGTLSGGGKQVVSIGSGGGVAGLWLLRGMRPDGVLTVLDTDPEQLRAARRALADAGVPPGRTRMIFGTPAEVLPRLSPGAYDLVVCAGPPADYAGHLAAVVGLVRPGGTLACHGLLAGDRIGDRAARDPADPRALNPAYDTGDHLHLNPTGYAALAAAVPLSLLH